MAAFGFLTPFLRSHQPTLAPPDRQHAQVAVGDEPRRGGVDLHAHPPLRLARQEQLEEGDAELADVVARRSR